MAGPPLLFEIKGNSLDDGPGIRTVVFFKGCPLECAWCHNPEGRRPGVELAFDARACVGSGACIRRCPEHALDRARPGLVDRAKCTLCFECVPVCPSRALARLGTELDVAAVIAEVRRDLPFFAASGGGVTFSGGEPAMFPTFAGELARALEALGVHLLVETCGQYDAGLFDEHLYPHIDLIYFDLKLVDDAEHRRRCGTGNRRILDNFTTLWRRAREGGAEVLPRVPLVPGMTATPDNLRGIAAFLRAQGAGRVALLPYNPLWPDKLGKLGDAPVALGGAGAGDGALGRFMTREEVAACRAWFEGFEVVAG